MLSGGCLLAFLVMVGLSMALKTYEVGGNDRLLTDSSLSLAFWTDDEFCKVNINTAMDGVYWDVPRLMSWEDYGKNP